MNSYQMYFLLLFTFLYQNCIAQKKTNFIPIIDQNTPFDRDPLDSVGQKKWVFQDIEHDSMPGVSLDRAYNTILKNKKGKEVIVAVIDTPIQIEHPSLQNHIWINTDEIPNNRIDDDQNGYIDDIHGWNYIANGKTQQRFVNFECTRLLRKYNADSVLRIQDSARYHRILQKYQYEREYVKEDNDYIDMVTTSKRECKEYLAKHIDSANYTLRDLERVKKQFPKDSILQTKALILSNFINWSGFDDYSLRKRQLIAKKRSEILLNLDYNDRELTGDDGNDFTNTQYGSPYVNLDTRFLDHGTSMAGTIVTDRDNPWGVRGIYDQAKIMSLCVAACGDEHDKDIALAIRYAVDNGAQVINMSFGKEFSLHKAWVFDALRYAEQHNVLLVSAAGNSRYDLNRNNDIYPNDNINNGKELSDNFINVGASTYYINEKLPAYFSNYGTIDVDLFAPGFEVYNVATNPQKYRFVRGAGTSKACAVTSGIAALLYGYYPELTVSQIKKILIESGVRYNLDVNQPSYEKEKTKVPFSSLSKSGRIVNAYNAVIMAEELVGE